MKLLHYAYYDSHPLFYHAVKDASLLRSANVMMTTLTKIIILNQISPYGIFHPQNQ